MSTVMRDEVDVQEFFDDIADDFARVNFKPFLRDELVGLAGVHSYYFALEVGPDGVAWPENADSTIAAKGHERILRGKPKNRRRLERSLTSKGGTADAVREIHETDLQSFLAFGTEVEYSHYHDNPYGELPYRPHIGVPPAYVDAFCDRAVDYWFNKLARA